MRRVAVPTAPLTTMPMMSTDMARPSTPNATTNGAKGAVLRSALLLDGGPGLRPPRRSGGDSDRDHGAVGGDSATVAAAANR